MVDSCSACKRRHRKMGVQLMTLMSHLPESRTKAGEPPFGRAGVDYFGQLLERECSPYW